MKTAAALAAAADAMFTAPASVTNVSVAATFVDCAQLAAAEVDCLPGSRVWSVWLGSCTWEHIPSWLLLILAGCVQITILSQNEVCGSNQPKNAARDGPSW